MIILLKVYQCGNDRFCAKSCSYCRLQKCLLSGMNIFSVNKTGLGRGRKIESIEYTAEQIEEILKTGRLNELDDYKLESDEISIFEESVDETITDPCQVCFTRQGQRHFGVKTCRGCHEFFVRSIKNANTYNCTGHKTCTTGCKYCRLKNCLQAGMNALAVFNTDLGKGRKIKPIEYTTEQIEEVLTTGCLKENTEFVTKKLSENKLSRNECKLCSKPNSLKHYGVVSCDTCRLFFFRVISKFKPLHCRENKDCTEGCAFCRLKKFLNAGMNILG